MHLLNLTLQSPTAINVAIYGNFTSSKSQEFLVSHGNTFELLRPDENGKLISIYSTEIFGIIRSMLPFRLTGGTKDYIIIGSDSGKLIVLEANPNVSSSNTISNNNNNNNLNYSNKYFEIKHSETYGKTGCRRLTPGQYLAVDPKGRAIMVGAIEKQKLVYVMNRDTSNRLTISSPLEAHRTGAIHFSIVGMDVGFENPIFACLELDYAESDSDPSGEAAKSAVKNIVYYELDLGLNHVTRRWSREVSRSANLLIAVPGGNEGPGGVLVCSENYISYYDENHSVLTCNIPQRKGNNKNSIIVSSSTHKQRDLFFILVQSELGDLFKISLIYEENNVSCLKIKYFDTIPVSNGLCITKTGYLFSGSEFSNHYLFQFQGIGDDDDTIECTSNDNNNNNNISFLHRSLKNLAIVDCLESSAPMIDCHIGDLANEKSPQIYALTGTNNRSSLRIFRHGLPMAEMAVSELPGIPNAVWCIKENNESNIDKYIVVSFQNETLVLEIGESVEEVTDSGILGSSSTLLVLLLADNSILQIHPNGIRHIRKLQQEIITEWKAPGKKIIERCAANSKQVVISFSGGEIIYFELDLLNTDSLIEKETIEIGMEISALDLGIVPEGRQRFPFLAIAGWDHTVRILSLDPNYLLKQISTQALNSHADSLCMIEMDNDDMNHSNNKLVYLYVGLNNGILHRTEIDLLTGTLSNTRTRFLGQKSIKLFRIKVQNGKNGVLALSSKSWLSYYYHNKYHLTPLSYESLTYASNFTSDQCTEGIVAISSNTLRVISVDKYDGLFNQQKISLKYTPRKMLIHSITKKIIIIQSDHNEIHKDIKNQNVYNINNNNEKEKEDDEYLFHVKEIQPKEKGEWASCISIYDPISNQILSNIHLEENEAAISIGSVIFHDRGGECFIIIGTIINLILPSHKEHKGGYLRVYRLIENKDLIMVHSTPINDIPYAICQFHGRALISIGSSLRLYDLGKRKLLRKCENKNSIPTVLTKLYVAGNGNNNRIYASDMNESFHMIKYKKEENQLYFFADDCIPRYITCQTVLDFDTIAGGDKFGNLFINRLPPEVSDDIENPTGNRILWDTGLLNGAPNKLENIVQFYIGEVITSMIKTTLVTAGLEALIYCTITGRIGAFIPFTSKEDIDFYSQLEMFMRQESDDFSFTGRDHLAYRSYFIPVKNVIDGDLCEKYLNLSLNKQNTIATDLDRTVNDIIKKMEDIRNRLL